MMTEPDTHSPSAPPRDGALVVGYLTGAGSTPVIRVTASAGGREVASRSVTSRQQVLAEVDAWLDLLDVQ